RFGVDIRRVLGRHFAGDGPRLGDDLAIGMYVHGWTFYTNSGGWRLQDPLAVVPIGVVAERAFGEVEHRVTELQTHERGALAQEPRLELPEVELRRHRQAAERARVDAVDAAGLGVEHVRVATLARDLLEARRAATAGRREQRHRSPDILFNLLLRAAQLFAQMKRRELGQKVAMVEPVRLDRHAGVGHLAQLRPGRVAGRAHLRRVHEEVGARARRLEHRRRDRVVGLEAVVEGEDDAGLAGEPVVRADSAAAESQGELELLTETRAVDAVVRIDVRAVRGAHRVI